MATPELRTEAPEVAPSTVHLPAPTGWPIILAFGVTLLFAGLLTSVSVSILGAILFVSGSVGWFRDVLPHEKEETVAVREKAPVVATSLRTVERLPVAPHLPRPLLPLETYPVSAGIKGGLAGSVAMAVLACLYGLLKQRSIWYPINLLAATVYTQSLRSGTASLDVFHLDSFLIALVIHLFTSLVVQPWPSLARWPRWSIPLYLFCATLPCDTLSAFLAFCDRVVYSSYLAAPHLINISPLQDQECAAALMWTCVTIILVVPAVVVTIQILSPEGSHLPDETRTKFQRIAGQALDASKLEVT